MYPAVTLDGFISDLDGQCYQWISDEDEAHYKQAIKNAGCAIVGRKTYEQYIDGYPERDAVTFVYTHRADYKDTDNVKFVTGSPADVLKQVEAHGFSEVILSGGGEVNGAFAEAGLVSEILISIYGLTLGKGIPLFGTYQPKLNLELLSTSQPATGIVKNHYRVVRG